MPEEIPLTPATLPVESKSKDAPNPIRRPPKMLNKFSLMEVILACD
jgi:hypothetical protein